MCPEWRGPSLDGAVVSVSHFASAEQRARGFVLGLERDRLVRAGTPVAAHRHRGPAGEVPADLPAPADLQAVLVERLGRTDDEEAVAAGERDFEAHAEQCTSLSTKIGVFREI